MNGIDGSKGKQGLPGNPGTPGIPGIKGDKGTQGKNHLSQPLAFHTSTYWHLEGHNPWPSTLVPIGTLRDKDQSI